MKKLVFILFASLPLTPLIAKKVMFTVNMTGQTTISALGMHIMGDFQTAAGVGADWTPNTCLMTQDAVDSNLYHYTVDIPAFAKYEFKYLNGDQSYEVEVVPLESQVGYNFDDNRWIFIDSLDADTMKLAPVVFSANAPLGLHMIRFLVDMTTQPYNATGVHVAGSFQGNDPSTHRMYSFGNNVFEIISYMPLGSYTYVYYNGNTSTQAETVPSPCAVSGQRAINLGIDTVLPNVCFSSCLTCYPTFVLPTAFDASITMFPNPMNQQTSIFFKDASDYHHVVLTDFTGRQIVKKLFVREKTLNIARATLSKGIYSVTVENNRGKRLSQQLIVE